MILIDAVFINDGGGKVLLDYLIHSLELKKTDCFYLLDERIIENHPVITNDRQVVYVKATLRNRLNFYKENYDRFGQVLCFGNIPPPIKLARATVYTYFHQPLFLNIPADHGFKLKLLYSLKMFYLNRKKLNTSYWLVQNVIVRDKLLSKYRLKPEKVLVLPFYPPFHEDTLIAYKRKSCSFIYVSNDTPHKNHLRLISSFCQFFDQTRQGSLTLTLPDSAVGLLEMIKQKQDLGYPIINLGFIPRAALYKAYKSHEYLIFPSLAESFGLGLVEAITCGCKVIGADLPYTYAVCEPSIVFDPFDGASMVAAMLKATHYDDVPFSNQKIKNEIDGLISLLNTSPQMQIN
ncbi:glycosyltransferase [Sphingobacterium sp. MYb388]|uniref:glycosyltransferase n=1 Tax=Sphingobacterium sp. MYb388 TaxID=2745437 RepID=UPI0030AE3992